MKCRRCKKEFEFPVYEEEVMILHHPFTDKWYPIEPTGRMMPICPFCSLSVNGGPGYDGSVVKSGLICGPKSWAKEKIMELDILRMEKEVEA